jgi:hypothetical protein
MQARSLRLRQGLHRVMSMRLGETIHSHYAVSFTGIAAAYLAADILIDRHLVTGIALTLIGAFGFVAWVMTLPRLRLWDLDLTALIRFWLLVVICGGTSVFLVQKYYDERNYQSSLPAGSPVPADGKTRPSWCPAPFRCE